MYVCFITNLTSATAIGHTTPISILTGSTPDCSPLLQFAWWDAVYFKLDDSGFPSDSPELKGRFVGISEHVVHAMTFKILNMDTMKVLHCANVRPANAPNTRNIRADLIKSNDDSKFSTTFSTGDDANNVENDGIEKNSVPVFNPHDLVGRTFLLNPEEDGQITSQNRQGH
jgi:hypothetical protein